MSGYVFLAKDSADRSPVSACSWSTRKRAASGSAPASSANACASPSNAGATNKVTLWTRCVLTAARHIYEKAGFKLKRTEEHRSWSQPVRVSEHWDLEL